MTRNGIIYIFVCDASTDSIRVHLVAVTDTLIIDVTLGSLPELYYLNRIKVFPNPTNDIINIDAGNYLEMSGYKIRIINTLSQIMFETDVNEQSYKININTFSEYGIYYIQIIDPGMNIIDIRKILLE